jgi:hypothetical protein
VRFRAPLLALQKSEKYRGGMGQMDKSMDMVATKASSVGAVRQILLGTAILVAASQTAPAASTTLICDVPTPPGSCCVIDGPGTVELNEAGGSITLHSPPMHTSNQSYPSGVARYAAKFDPKTITFVGSETATSGGVGEKITINRLTGMFVMNGLTWTCRVGKPQF